MRNLVISLLLLAMATGCSLNPLKMLQRKPTAEQQLAAVLQAHPDLLKPDTIKVAVPILVPQVQFEKEFVQVHSPVIEQRERAELDSLIEHLQTSLDSAQASAVKAKLHQLLLQRPVLRDTLCFDTCGVKGRIWLQGRNYKLSIVRAAIQDTAKTQVVAGRLAPCPLLPQFSIFRPDTWGFPWWAWLLAGVVLGMALLRGLVGIVYSLQNRGNA